MLPAIARKRRAIQRGRRVGLAALDAAISPESWGSGSLPERVRGLAREAAPLVRRRARGRRGRAG